MSDFVKDKSLCVEPSSQGDDKRLVHVVRKISNLDCGTFGNISDDLGFIENFDNQPPMIKMAYAYARRTVAAGLFYQGIFNFDAFLQASIVFQGLQLTTGQTKEFQEEAAKQAIELLLSYDKRLDKEFSSYITSAALSNQNSLNVEQYPEISYEQVLANLDTIIKDYKNSTLAKQASLEKTSSLSKDESNKNELNNKDTSNLTLNLNKQNNTSSQHKNLNTSVNTAKNLNTNLQKDSKSQTLKFVLIAISFIVLVMAFFLIIFKVVNYDKKETIENLEDAKIQQETIETQNQQSENTQAKNLISDKYNLKKQYQVEPNIANEAEQYFDMKTKLVDPMERIKFFVDNGLLKNLTEQELMYLLAEISSNRTVDANKIENYLININEEFQRRLLEKNNDDAKEILHEIYSDINKQKKFLKQYLENSKISADAQVTTTRLFWFLKNFELNLLLDESLGNKKEIFCKKLECTKQETNNLNLYFADTYNQVREICKAGFCKEDDIKAFELAWINYKNKLLKFETIKNIQTRNNHQIKFVANQIEILNFIINTVGNGIEDKDRYFDFTTYKKLYDSLIAHQNKLSTYSVEQLNMLNVHLSTIVLTRLYNSLEKKSIDVSKLKVLSGSYDLSYREFLVSSNRKTFGKKYDRKLTEIAKVEGKINRAKHLLYLLLEDSEILQLSTKFDTFECLNNICISDELKKNSGYIETAYSELKNNCSPKRCDKKKLVEQENNWVVYTREWYKLIQKNKSADVQNNLIILYNNDNIARLLDAYITYK